MFCRLYFAATSGVCLIRSGAAGFSKETTFAKEVALCVHAHATRRARFTACGVPSPPPHALSRYIRGPARASIRAPVARVPYWASSEHFRGSQLYCNVSVEGTNTRTTINVVILLLS
jgi:hypothetical protein